MGGAPIPACRLNNSTSIPHRHHRPGWLLATACLVACLVALLIRQSRPRLVPPTPFVVWAKQHAMTMRTAEPGSGFDDLRPLRRLIGNARVVGMGEATHGTHEFFRFKHRIFEFLVEEMGFTAVAIEANFPDTVAVNRYVLDGLGQGPQVVRGMGFWTWETEEVLALVEWLRKHNSKVRASRKVRFYGFDMQSPEPAAGLALDYLKRIEPIPAGQFSALTALCWDIQGGRSTAARRLEARRLARRLLQYLEQIPKRIPGAPDDWEWRYACQEARIAAQALEWAEVKPSASL